MLKLAVPTALLLLLCASTSASVGETPLHQFVVLDGDTIVVDGSAIHVAGIDAPELGPWARCWAEAALAGHAREQLQRTLADADRGGWSLTDISMPDARGTRTARLVDRNGYDIADDMVVYGSAAQTTTTWGWCGEHESSPSAGGRARSAWSEPLVAHGTHVRRARRGLAAVQPLIEKVDDRDGRANPVRHLPPAVTLVGEQHVLDRHAAAVSGSPRFARPRRPARWCRWRHAARWSARLRGRPCESVTVASAARLGSRDHRIRSSRSPPSTVRYA